MAKNKQHPIEVHFNHVTRYHYYCFTIMFLTKIPMYWHIMSLIFLSPPMYFTCNGTSTDACPCDNPVWDKSVFTKTMQTKFDIVCEKVWLISFSQSMLYVGTLIGSLFFGFMADRYGRLSMFTICCLCLGISGLLVIVMPTSASFIFMRCIEGVGIGGAIVTGYVLVVEYCGTNYRDTVTALYHLPLNIGHITLAGLSYFLRDCDLFQLAVTLPMFLCLIPWWILYESPKWLLDSDHHDRAVAVMRKIGKFNGNDSWESIETEIQEYDATQTKSVRKVSFWQIFRHKKLVLNLLCMSYIYFVCGMGYYGVSQYIGKMSGDIHLNVAVSGVLLFPGTFITIFLLKILSRRTFLISTNVLSGLFMITVVCIPADLKFPRMIVASIGNTCFFMSFIIVFLYSVELFPTSVRNSVLGFLSVLSRIGQIVAPPVNALNSILAGSIFGISAIVGAILCYPLPETKNTELPSTLEDSEALSHRKIRTSTTE